MQLAVFGATGRTGKPLVAQGLARGHSLRALVRDPAKATLLPDAESLTLVHGDLLDPAAVAATVDGSQAVIDVSGRAKGSPPDFRQRVVGHLLDGMHAHGVRRLVVLTGAGVRAAGDEPKVVDRLFVFLLRRLQPALLADAEAYVAAVVASDVDWTVVRVPRLTDDEPRGVYRHTPTVGKHSGTKLARADAATFLLDTVEQDRFMRQLPVVSW